MVHKDCSLQLWDKILQQAENTLNMLRSSRANIKLSAYEDLHRAFKFNHTPIVLCGKKGLAFVDPHKRTTFGPHVLDIFVVDRAPLHYRLLNFIHQHQSVHDNRHVQAVSNELQYAGHL